MRTLFLLPLAFVAGCAVPTTPQYDLRFGDAVRTAKQQMIINPAAGTQAAVPAGTDGLSAIEAIHRYEDSYKSPPPTVNVINIGGGLAGSTK